MAPTSVSDCLGVIALAFDLAEKYQMPVIVLVDQSLSSRLESVEQHLVRKTPSISRLTVQPSSDAPFNRYQLTESGVSPVALPGTDGGEHMITGLEHTQRGGFACDEETHTAMTVKRYRKLSSIESDPLTQNQSMYFGDDNAEIGLLAWGSTAGR